MQGRPCGCANETRLAFKRVKRIKGEEFVADFGDIGGSYGGLPPRTMSSSGTDNPSDTHRWIRRDLLLRAPCLV